MTATVGRSGWNKQSDWTLFVIDWQYSFVVQEIGCKSPVQVPSWRIFIITTGSGIRTAVI